MGGFSLAVKQYKKCHIDGMIVKKMQTMSTQAKTCSVLPMGGLAGIRLLSAGFYFSAQR